jgi:hypothetical protein
LDGFPYFSRRLNSLAYPKKFKSIHIDNYYDKKDPKNQWILCYSTPIDHMGGNKDIKAIYIPMVLEDTPLTWLKQLSKASSITG